MFYVLVFTGLAVLLVIAGATVKARNREREQAEARQRHHPRDVSRQQRKARRAQSSRDRRKHH